MNHHLEGALISNTSDIKAECSQEAFNRVVNVIQKTLLDKDKMKFWNDIFEGMPEYNSLSYYNTNPIPVGQAAKSMGRGRHDLPFKDVNGNIAYLACMCSEFRGQYIGYSDTIVLSQVVAGLHAKSIEGAEELNAEFNAFKFNKLGETLNWFNNSVVISGINNIEKDPAQYYFKYDAIQEDLKELHTKINSMLVKYSSKERLDIRCLPDITPLEQKLFEITKQEQIDLKDIKSISKVIHSASNSLLWKEGVNRYIHETFQDTLVDESSITKKKSKIPKI